MQETGKPGENHYIKLGSWAAAMNEDPRGKKAGAYPKSYRSCLSIWVVVLLAFNFLWVSSLIVIPKVHLSRSTTISAKPGTLGEIKRGAKFGARS